jgi:hypothetical protein
MLVTLKSFENVGEFKYLGAPVKGKDIPVTGLGGP